MCNSKKRLFILQLTDPFKFYLSDSATTYLTTITTTITILPLHIPYTPFIGKAGAVSNRRNITRPSSLICICTHSQEAGANAYSCLYKTTVEIFGIAPPA